MEKKSQQKQQQQAEMIPFDAEHEKLMREEFLRRKKLNDNGQFDDVVSGR